MMFADELGLLGPRTLCNACGLVFAKMVRGFVRALPMMIAG
jgi:hypothetical protein